MKEKTNLALRKILASVGIAPVLWAASQLSAVHADQIGRRHGPPPRMMDEQKKLTDAQKTCFTSQGLAAPEAGQNPPSEPPSPEVMEKVDACLHQTPHENQGDQQSCKGKKREGEKHGEKHAEEDSLDS